MAPQHGLQHWRGMFAVRYPRFFLDFTATSLHATSASVVDEAKRWFECATVICRFVPDGKARAEKVRENG